ncbi:MAG: polymerase DnaE [Paenibacillus sp.]|nr:polymerase DnaE [Paenibacillus sp.]
MQIASKMAGFTLGEADLLRRAVSKKKREVLDEEREHFVKGSVTQGYSEAEANKVYDMIVRFADYGFPRAHATAYGVLAFQTAYLKAHYPVQFMASMLTAVMGSHNKVAEYVDECRRMGITVLPPDVNESGVVFTPAAQPVHLGGSGAAPGADARHADAAHSPALADGGAVPEQPDAEGIAGAGAAVRAAEAVPAAPGRGAIRFGLAAIKNVGTHAIDSIRQERSSGPYTSLLDLCRRVDLRVCNKRVLESLIQGGAADSLPGHRAQQLEMLEDTIEAAVKWRKERDDLQLHLFGFVEDVNWEVEYPEIRPFTMTQQLELERELLGLYISGSPLDDYEEVLRVLETDPLHQLQELPDHSEVIVAGLVLSNKTIVTKKGQPMAFIELEDRVAKVEVVLFPEAWKQYAPLVQKGNPVLVRAKLQQGDEDVKLLADQLIALSDPQLQLKAARRPSAGHNAALTRQAGDRPSGAGGRAPAAAARPAPQPQSGPRASAPQAAPAAPSSGARQQSASAPAPQAARPQLQASPARPAAAEQPHKASEAAPAAAVPPASASQRTVQAGAASAPRQQRVYVKISADHEQPQVLTGLKQLLEEHGGPLSVILYYEKSQKTLGLSDQYKVKPSPKLFQAIEELLGKDSVKVK